MDRFIVQPKFVIKAVTLEKEVSQDYQSNFALVQVPTYDNTTPTPIFTKPYCIYKPVVFDRPLIPLAIVPLGAYGSVNPPTMILWYRGTMTGQEQYQVDEANTKILSALTLLNTGITATATPSAALALLDVNQDLMVPTGAHRFAGFDARPNQLIYAQLNY